ncbi:hypothetical protein F2Q69_00032831 [Brassica cretica]|uniref:PB1 domain-containing protein n=1 Tax=Brassica cretica TaxID=69181 RepID=A0A8S9SII3_BRACR|nr:hypothetical protein F2Q69_00032831 [Brassica cretica]
MEGSGGGGGGDGGFLPNPSFGAFPETAMDMDFMEELFFDGCWLETTDGKSLKQTSGQQAPSSTNMNDNNNNNNNSFLYGYQFAENPSQDHISNEDTGRKLPPGFLKMEDLTNQPMTQVSFDQSAAMSSAQAEKFLLEETERGRRYWIAPRTSQGPSSSVKDRLFQAINGLKVQDKDFLIQIWVPIQQEGKNFLTTLEQPHFFNPKYKSLKRYRDVSVSYNFLADEDSKESVGLPGRVFLGKLPEWTPDVRFFRSEEYPRIKEAQRCDVRGSLALPVFESGSGICLGVVEIVTTTQKMNYRPELENICKALEAVNLRSSANMKSPSICPTTLKRICRQHGITRWPSRKIKKVGHSLKKLQLVIDSVQGVQGSIQLDSFYTSFPELSSPNNVSSTGTGTSFKNNDQPSHLNPQTENGVSVQGNAVAPTSSPPSSSCSHSSGSSTCCSTGANQSTNTANTSNTISTLMAENAGAILKRARSEVRLRTVNQEETKSLSRTLSHRAFSEHPLLNNLPRLPESRSRSLKAGGASKVKATFGEAKVRFTLLPTWGFRELQHEIARRFNIDNNIIATFDLKYLDDDKEWVLLTCEADLEECIDIYRSSQSRTIKISVHEASQAKLGGSFGSTGPVPLL